MKRLILLLLLLFPVAVFADAIDDMPIHTWYEIPNTHLRGSTAQYTPAGGVFEGIIAAWCGGAVDTTRHRMMVGPCGGHNSYEYNETYGFDLDQGDLAWHRVSEPSFPFGIADSGEKCPTSLNYPCAIHTYSAVQYSPVVDRYWHLNWPVWSNAWGSAQPAYLQNPTNGTWSLSPTITFSGRTGGMSAYDSVHDVVWYRATGYGPLASYSFATNTWTSHGDQPHAVCLYRAAAFDPVRKRVILIGSEPDVSNCSGDYWRVPVMIDASNPSAGTITETSITTSGDKTCEGRQSPGFEYDPVTDTMICYGGIGASADTAVYQLNLTTFAWTKIPVASGSGPPATVAQDNGVLGRFRYVPSRNVFVYISDVDNNVWVYKLTAGNSQDFAQRCNAAGVIRCFGFDSNADLKSGSGVTGDNYGSFNNSAATASGGNYLTNNLDGTCGPDQYQGRGLQQCPQIDTSIKASGGGSMKFTVPTNSTSDTSGQWFTNFSSDLLTQFGSGTNFYISYRQRFSPCQLYNGTDDANCLANGTRRRYANGDGFKQSIIGSGDQATCPANRNSPTCTGSCTWQELVGQNSQQYGVPQMYHSCGRFTGLDQLEPKGPPDYYWLQNAYVDHCPYSEVNPTNYSLAHCIPYYANEWLSFKFHITLGTYDTTNHYYPNSHVEQWIARDGGSWVKTQDYTMTLYNDDGGSTEAYKYGKIWLLPYNSHQTAESHPTAYTWYDELIISTQDIAVPGTFTATPAQSTVASGKISIGGKAAVH